MEQDLLELLKPVLATSPFAVVAWFLYVSGVFKALASRLRKNGDDKRVTSLQEWQKEAEENHFSELKELIKDVKWLKEKYYEMDKTVAVLISEFKRRNGR